ncbi:MAG TPA: TIGR02206 family membrane protein [Rhizomicrobium sp.]|nr:TIGR02206 family membrane protein [Rhizomicrobium sp.]
MANPFVRFGSAHLTVIALTFILPFALAAIVRKAQNRALARGISLALAAELIATWTLWYWLIVSQGWVSVTTLLPMDLCDWAAIATLITLLWPNQRSYELAWFWSLSGTLQALLTPNLAYGFPDPRFIVFFGFHGGVIASVLYLTLGRGMRPWPGSIPRVIAWSFAYFLAALATNAAFHTNFGYLRAKPEASSLLDYLGPWPVYLFALVGLGLLFTLLLYLPFLLADQSRILRRSRHG